MTGIFFALTRNGHNRAWRVSGAHFSIRETAMTASTYLKSRVRRLRSCLLASSVALFAVAAHAAPTLLVSDGVLLGADNVFESDGFSYSVRFTSGTCAGVFSGCASTDDLTRNNEALGFDAAQELREWVLIDGPAGFFNAFPNLTAGCFISVYCNVYMPLSVFEDSTGAKRVMTVSIYNMQNPINDPEWQDEIFYSNAQHALYIDEELTGDTWAVWSRAELDPTPVAEPSSLALLGLAAAALGWSQRRRRVRAP